MNTYVFLKFLGHLALPPASLLMGLVVAGIVALLGFRRVAVGIAVFSVAEILILCSAPVADLLIEPLQNEARLEAKAAKSCCYDAILVLGGAISPGSADSPEPTLTGSSDRIWLAARMYKKGVAPRIIVSGGVFVAPDMPAISEAEAMRRFLIDLGVPSEAIIEEGHSLNTLQNIAYVRELVQGKSVALVTSAYHMPRALRIARRGGLNVSAFPTEWHSESDGVIWATLLPSGSAMATSSLAIWEYMALLLDYRAVPPSL